MPTPNKQAKPQPERLVIYVAKDSGEVLVCSAAHETKMLKEYFTEDPDDHSRHAKRRDLNHYTRMTTTFQPVVVISHKLGATPD